MDKLAGRRRGQGGHPHGPTGTVEGGGQDRLLPLVHGAGYITGQNILVDGGVNRRI